MNEKQPKVCVANCGGPEGDENRTGGKLLTRWFRNGNEMVC